MYYYLSKNGLLNREVMVILYSESRIENYKDIINQGELVEYIGDNIPNDWRYDQENDVVFAESDRPSPYHVYIQGTWIIKDQEGYKKYCFEEIDKIKAKVLEYGFDFEVSGTHHRQKCRDKDIAYLTSTLVAMQTIKAVLNKDITKTWYFEDNDGVEFNLIGISTLMMYGVTFVQSVFGTENYFKSLEEVRFITQDEFETKRREIHGVLANGGD